MKNAIPLIALASLSACAATPCVPSIQVQKVEVPVPVRCVDQKDIPAEPDTLSLTGDARNDTALLASKVAGLRVWGRQLTGMLTACSK